ncbi:MAG: carbohydrate ABC transporter permease [Ruminococcus sp.]|uniref:carbohydrate ABC transporter permease n=1 Tax=Ruminococcus sp. TaxID=41978 RepID=UPI001B2F4C22|nr:carbohydrate ABC transporter permease [Ruminococcus sp.]MBO7474190.1 carbohydrate ABC transporter permease [Ruminococcus sp.]
MKLKRLTLRHKRRVFNCMILVFIFLVALVFLMPTVLTIANSFMTSKEITSNYGAMFKNMISGKKDIISENVNLKFIPDKVTFAQYKAVLIQNSDYLMKFWNSVILTVPITVFQMLVAILTAYGFSRYPNKFKSIIFFAYIILMIMPYQVTLVPNFLVADKFNMLDTRKAIILPAIFSPFSIFLLTKVMRRIPVSYVEAAKLDGASELKILTKIYVPLCKGAIVSISMLVFIDYWNMVEQPIVLMKNNNLHPLSVFLSEINTGDIGLAFAVGTVYMIPTVLMFLYGEDYLIEGISYSGGIKG